MKKIIPIILLFSLNSVFAGAFDQFLIGLQGDYYFVKSDRGTELTHHVRVAKFGLLDRVMSPDAVATYNDKLNTIKLDETLIEETEEGKRIRDARIIRGADYAKTPHLSTVFHEMGHAEIDVFIENGREAHDQVLSSFYKNTLKPFYKKHFPAFNSYTVFHEHFAYYRTDILEFLSNEVDQVLMINGFNKFRRSCFLTHPLKKKLAEGIGLEEFKIFFTGAEVVSYKDKIGPRYIYVKGKDIDLQSAINGQATLKQAHHHFWNYHSEFYGFPASQKVLVDRMNARSEYKKALEECRTKMWLEASSR